MILDRNLDFTLIILLTFSFIECIKSETIYLKALQIPTVLSSLNANLKKFNLSNISWYLVAVSFNMCMLMWLASAFFLLAKYNYFKYIL